MSPVAETGRTPSSRRDAPPANRPLLAVAAVLLALPIVALLLVGTYARRTPTLWGFPFFIWYQFLWVFLCSACTYAAYRIVLVARPHVPIRPDSRPDGQRDDHTGQVTR